MEQKSTEEGVGKFVDLFNVEKDSDDTPDVLDKEEVLKVLEGKHLTMDQFKDIVLTNGTLRELYKTLQTKECWKQFVSEMEAQGYPNINDMLANATFLQYYVVHQRRGNANHKVATLGYDRIRAIPLSDWKSFSWFESLKAVTMLVMMNIAWPPRPFSSFRKNFTTYTGFDSFSVVLNIMEAAMRDFQLGYFDNAMTGVILCLVMPFWHLHDINQDQVVIGRLTTEWVNLYISWNSAFVVYGLDDMPHKPIAFSKLICVQIEMQEEGPTTYMATPVGFLLNSVCVCVCVSC
jgi:hypothetical protein